MADDLIPDDLREFIYQHIESIAQLEALLLLRKNPNESWTAGATGKRLYITEAEAAAVLNQLCADDLLKCHGGIYRFNPNSARHDLVDRLAQAYARHLVPVTNMIHSRPRWLREFSNAFRIRKDNQ